MQILFTRNNMVLSRMIRAITGEDCSHCAIEDGTIVIHSNLWGPHVEDRSSFLDHSEIVHAVPVSSDPDKVLRLLGQSRWFGYDWGALFYLGLRCLFPWLPKANLWQMSGMYLCTEWVTEYLDDNENSSTTPHQLYERLVSK